MTGGRATPQPLLFEPMRWAWAGVVAGQFFFRLLPASETSAAIPPDDEKDWLAMTVTVYSKPACVQCTATTRALDAKGIAYRVVDLSKDAVALAKVAALGYKQAPVVIAGDAHWAGFRPDMIGRLA